MKREVIGGYVLYPGNLSASQFKGSYYQQSIDEVNIGAFPLKPGGHWKGLYDKDGYINDLLVDPASSEQVLYEKIEKWLNEKEPRQELLDTSIPQKGLEYSMESKGCFFLSSIDAHVNSDVDAIVNGRAEVFVSGYSAILSGIDFQKIKYFAPVSNHLVNGYYTVVGVSAVDRRLTSHLFTVLTVMHQRELLCQEKSLMTIGRRITKTFL